MFAKKIYVLGVALAVILCIGLSGAIAKDDCNFFGCKNDCKFTTDFRLQDCESFQNTGTNPYFILTPGYQLVLESEEERVEVTVLSDTESIVLTAAGLGVVETRVVEEREYELDDGEEVLIEVSRNFFAICEKTNSVYYFGEDSAGCDPEETGGFAEDGVMCANGEAPDTEGSWRAGTNEALPGLIMPGTILLGAKYFQELAPNDDAVDRGQIVKMGLTVEDPKGGEAFTGCVKVKDTNPAERICKKKDGDPKIYCPGIGLVQDEDLKLVCYGFDCGD